MGVDLAGLWTEWAEPRHEKKTAIVNTNNSGSKQLDHGICYVTSCRILTDKSRTPSSQR